MRYKGYIRFYLLFILVLCFVPIRAMQAAPAIADSSELTLSERINRQFTPLVEAMTRVLFWDPFEAMGIYDPVQRDAQGHPLLNAQGEEVKAPLRFIVLWLMGGGLFFTLYLRFIGIRGMRHGIRLMLRKNSGTKMPGEVSQFKSVMTALSATVGMGNIAGVAIGIGIGGPGATFWMILAGLLGMAMKFAECSLGVKYRVINEKGEVSGGPMYYLKYGLKKRGMGLPGSILALLFALMAVGGSVGGGNMLQANQAFKQLTVFFPALNAYGVWYGLVLAFLTGLVIVGGIKSIARVTSKIVPFMAVLYVLSALVIIALNIQKTGEAFALIFHGAFAPGAMKGGFVGVLIYGFQRGAFSNEAGIGSAAIAHSASRTTKHISEGFVAAVEPFIDTVLICSMTALVLIFTGYSENTRSLQGVMLTNAAFASVFSWFPYLLLIAVSLFAFSTMISWSYYGQKGFDYLFAPLAKRYLGNSIYSTRLFQFIFLAFVVVGASSDIMAVMDFSDMMILAMAFPNLIGLFIMAPEIKKDLKAYQQGLKAGH